MKKLRIMICVFALTSLFCVPVLADSYVLGRNSSRGLAHGTASTSCTNNLYTHSYTTKGTAASLSHRISVYVADKYGNTMKSASSTSSSRYASTTWNVDTSTSHKHAAASALFTRSVE